MRYILALLLIASTCDAQSERSGRRILGREGLSRVQSSAFAIVATAGVNGGISPSGTSLCTYGSSKTFTFTPTGDYAIDSVFVDGSYVGYQSSYTFSNISAAHTISVQFVGAYFVAKTGNDGTGDGSSAAPWLTISKAYTTIAAGVVVKIKAGTYQENTGGNGFLYINKAFAKRIRLEGYDLNADSVIVMGATSSSNNTEIRTAATNTVFRKLTFTMRDTANYQSVWITYAQNVTFDSVVVINTTRATSGGAGVYVHPGGNSESGANNVYNLTFSGCTFSQTGTGTTALPFNVYGQYAGKLHTLSVLNCTASGIYRPLYFSGHGSNIRVIGCASTSSAGTGLYFDGFGYPYTMDSVTVTGGTFLGSSYGGNFKTGRNLWIDRCTFYGGADGGVKIGIDGHTPTDTLRGYIKNCRISAASAHAFLIGSGAIGFLAQYDTVDNSRGCGGTVIKQCGSVVVTDCVFDNRGYPYGTYFKAARNSRVSNCTMTSSTGYAVYASYDSETGGKNVADTLTNCTIISTGTAAMCSWGTEAQDIGENCVTDYNTYLHSGSGTSSILGTGGLTTIAGIRTAWSGYSSFATNESHSTGP